MNIADKSHSINIYLLYSFSKIKLPNIHPIAAPKGHKPVKIPIVSLFT